MTKNEKRLTTVFIWLCIIVLFAFLFISESEKLIRARDSIVQYSDLLEKMPQADEQHIAVLENRLEVLRNTQPAGNTGRPQNITDITAAVRASLTKHGIQAERFQISGKHPDESVEFILRCSPVLFFRFLRDESEAEQLYITYLSIRPSRDSSTTDINMRISNAK
ncbi:hypothetical protein K7I13_11270 [Brucepastera parasyntrophica]|uniref:hypothetical protein n=1 Tax=Brucepastera parasyntrophica TaxID=2880008 RepID=UPI00210B5597|nr:hypothetical protein [Brucepastera parasyntrophica]ULQ59083.1 hypothetical protein K7I13_11270 [Brucepastera parasyntrophica]